MPYAVVFSGGGALGSWETGCYEHLLLANGGEPPVCVTGASAGALNAAALCAGMSVQQVQQLWIDLKKSDVYTTDVPVSKLLWAISRAAAGKYTPLLKLAASRKSVLDAAPLAKRLAAIFKGYEAAFLGSPMWFAISLTNLTDRTKEMFYKTPPGEALPPSFQQATLPKEPPPVWKPVKSYLILNQALMGTTALPLIFPPFQSYFDGGVLLNQPISPAVQIMDVIVNPGTAEDPKAERKNPVDVYVFIPTAEALGTTEGLPDIASTLLSTWLATSLFSQITTLKLRNKIRNLAGDAPIRVCVVRPSQDFSAGLLDFGMNVPGLIQQGREDCEARLSRFEQANENTWY